MTEAVWYAALQTSTQAVVSGAINRLGVLGPSPPFDGDYSYSPAEELAYTALLTALLDLELTPPALCNSLLASYTAVLRELPGHAAAKDSPAILGAVFDRLCQLATDPAVVSAETEFAAAAVLDALVALAVASQSAGYMARAVGVLLESSPDVQVTLSGGGLNELRSLENTTVDSSWAAVLDADALRLGGPTAAAYSAPAPTMALALAHAAFARLESDVALPAHVAYRVPYSVSVTDSDLAALCELLAAVKARVDAGEALSASASGSDTTGHEHERSAAAAQRYILGCVVSAVGYNLYNAKAARSQGTVSIALPDSTAAATTGILIELSSTDNEDDTSIEFAASVALLAQAALSQGFSFLLPVSVRSRDVLDGLAKLKGGGGGKSDARGGSRLEFVLRGLLAQPWQDEGLGLTIPALEALAVCAARGTASHIAAIEAGVDLGGEDLNDDGSSIHSLAASVVFKVLVDAVASVEGAKKWPATLVNAVSPDELAAAASTVATVLADLVRAAAVTNTVLLTPSRRQPSRGFDSFAPADGDEGSPAATAADSAEGVGGSGSSAGGVGGADGDGGSGDLNGVESEDKAVHDRVAGVFSHCRLLSSVLPLVAGLAFSWDCDKRSAAALLPGLSALHRAIRPMGQYEAVVAAGAAGGADSLFALAVGSVSGGSGVGTGASAGAGVDGGDDDGGEVDADARRSDYRSGEIASVVVDSPHPYPSAYCRDHIVSIPGAAFLAVRFAPVSRLEDGDLVELRVPDPQGDSSGTTSDFAGVGPTSRLYRCLRGGSFPVEPVLVPGSTLIVRFAATSTLHEDPAVNNAVERYGLLATVRGYSEPLEGGPLDSLVSRLAISSARLSAKLVEPDFDSEPAGWNRVLNSDLFAAGLDGDHSTPLRYIDPVSARLAILPAEEPSLPGPVAGLLASLANYDPEAVSNSSRATSSSSGATSSSSDATSSGSGGGCGGGGKSAAEELSEEQLTAGALDVLASYGFEVLAGASGASGIGDGRSSKGKAAADSPTATESSRTLPPELLAALTPGGLAAVAGLIKVTGAAHALYDAAVAAATGAVLGGTSSGSNTGISAGVAGSSGRADEDSSPDRRLAKAVASANKAVRLLGGKMVSRIDVEVGNLLRNELAAAIGLRKIDGKVWVEANEQAPRFASTVRHSLIRGDVAVHRGRWYVEVNLQTAGNHLFVGWANADPSAITRRQYSVGDDEHSWGVAVHTRKKLHDGTAADYDIANVELDVVGCYLDLDSSPPTMEFSINGEYAGVAFSGFAVPPAGLCPLVKIIRKQTVTFRFPAESMEYFPEEDDEDDPRVWQPLTAAPGVKLPPGADSIRRDIEAARCATLNSELSNRGKSLLSLAAPGGCERGSGGSGSGSGGSGASGLGSSPPGSRGGGTKGSPPPPTPTNAGTPRRAGGAGKRANRPAILLPAQLPGSVDVSPSLLSPRLMSPSASGHPPSTPSQAAAYARELKADQTLERLGQLAAGTLTRQAVAFLVDPDTALNCSPAECVGYMLRRREAAVSRAVGFATFTYLLTELHVPELLIVVLRYLVAGLRCVEEDNNAAAGGGVGGGGAGGGGGNGQLSADNQQLPFAHFLHGLATAGPDATVLVTSAFRRLYKKLAGVVESSPLPASHIALALRAWNVRFTHADHDFLVACNVFGSLHRFMAHSRYYFFDLGADSDGDFDLFGDDGLEAEVSTGKGDQGDAAGGTGTPAAVSVLASHSHNFGYGTDFKAEVSDSNIGEEEIAKAFDPNPDTYAEIDERRSSVLITFERGVKNLGAIAILSQPDKDERWCPESVTVSFGAAAGDLEEVGQYETRGTGWFTVPVPERCRDRPVIRLSFRQRRLRLRGLRLVGYSPEAAVGGSGGDDALAASLPTLALHTFNALARRCLAGDEPEDGESLTEGGGVAGLASDGGRGVGGGGRGDGRGGFAASTPPTPSALVRAGSDLQSVLANMLFTSDSPLVSSSPETEALRRSVGEAVVIELGREAAKFAAAADQLEAARRAGAETGGNHCFVYDPQCSGSGSTTAPGSDIDVRFHYRSEGGDSSDEVEVIALLAPDTGVYLAPVTVFPGRYSYRVTVGGSDVTAALIESGAATASTAEPASSTESGPLATLVVLTPEQQAAAAKAEAKAAKAAARAAAVAEAAAVRAAAREAARAERHAALSAAASQRTEGIAALEAELGLSSSDAQLAYGKAGSLEKAKESVAAARSLVEELVVSGALESEWVDLRMALHLFRGSAKTGAAKALLESTSALTALGFPAELCLATLLATGEDTKVAADELLGGTALAYSLDDGSGTAGPAGGDDGGGDIGAAARDFRGEVAEEIVEDHPDVVRCAALAALALRECGDDTERAVEWLTRLDGAVAVPPTAGGPVVETAFNLSNMGFRFPIALFALLETDNNPDTALGLALEDGDRLDAKVEEEAAKGRAAAERAVAAAVAAADGTYDDMSDSEDDDEEGNGAGGGDGNDDRWPSDEAAFVLTNLLYTLTGSAVGTSLAAKRSSLEALCSLLRACPSGRVRRAACAVLTRATGAVLPQGLDAAASAVVGAAAESSRDVVPRLAPSIVADRLGWGLASWLYTASAGIGLDVKGPRGGRGGSAAFEPEATATAAVVRDAVPDGSVARRVLDLVSGVVCHGEEWANAGCSVVATTVAEGLVSLAAGVTAVDSPVQSPDLWLVAAAVAVHSALPEEDLTAALAVAAAEAGASIMGVADGGAGTKVTMDFRPPIARARLYVGTISEPCVVVIVDVVGLKAKVELRSLASPSGGSDDGVGSGGAGAEVGAAAVCRFCGEPAANPAAQLADAVCSSTLCASELESACNKVHHCGHVCGGVAGETSCLPCLVADCAATTTNDATNSTNSTNASTTVDDDTTTNADDDTTTNADGNSSNNNNSQQPRLLCEGEDYCNICWTDQLRARPAIQLSCGHVFHGECARDRLRHGWPTTEISYGFMTCPLCAVPMEHEFLAETAAPLHELKEAHTALAVMRLKFDGFDNRPEVTVPGGEYYGDLEGYALSRYSYFRCFSCSKPYFGGERVCGANGGGSANPEDLVCAPCSGVTGDCARHGTEYQEFKCRWCCSIAIWYCYGTTHFCDPCHQIDSFDENSPDLPQCEGGPDCPLKVEYHPKAGTEHCLGCGLCR